MGAVLCDCDPVMPDAGCHLCLAASQAGGDYFRRAFHGQAQMLGTGEAIADSLGYCARHAARLSRIPSLASPVATVFGRGVVLVQRLLDEAFFHEDIFQRMVFGAGTACPACRYERQRVAREFTKMGGDAALASAASHDGMCFHHQLAIGRTMTPHAQTDWLAGCGRWLGREADRLTLVLGTETAPAGSSPCRSLVSRLVGDQVRRMRCDDAGRGTISPVGEAMSSAGMADLIGHPDACPLCRWQDAATRRWLDDVTLALRFGEGGWLVFPTCAVHMALVLELEMPGLEMAMARHALDASGVRLQQDIDSVESCLAPPAASARRRLPRARWLPRQAAPRRKGDAKPARCPGCERGAVALDRAASTLLALLQESRWRQVFAAGHGLCMKHFAFVFPLAADGVVRTWLAADQRARLDRLREELDAAPVQAWRAAVHRFSGDRCLG
ncbi:hypothetical protein [Cupriavidus laharis]|uniref:hypothetical protein n=1 Tax=Cupriavidus laharis TaxID=151654 RepID=UPI001CC3917C|nr:hypothetical protein [Cupriavidus laharis]